jgi:hypothetical protein
MFQRRTGRNDMLPSTAYGTGSGGGGGLPLGGFGGGGGSLDGSGRSVKMDAPVVKAWKKASGYTKYSYYFLGFTCFLIFYGFRSLRYWNCTSNLVLSIFVELSSAALRSSRSATILSESNIKIFIFLKPHTFFAFQFFECNRNYFALTEPA